MKKIIRTHAALIARITAMATVVGIIVVVLLNQPAFYSANPIFAGQIPQVETMVTSQQEDDIDTDVTIEEEPKDKKEEKKETHPQKNDNRDTKTQKNDDNKSDDSKGGKNNTSKKNGDGDNETGAKPELDPDSDKGNKTGIADNDNSGNRGDTGNNGRESPNPASGSTDEPVIVSDLNGYDDPRIITFKELPSGKLEFYAYIANKEKDMDLRVKVFNANTNDAGKYLNGDGRDYTAELTQGKNRITLYMRKNGRVTYHITYNIRYVPNKADKDDPAVGEHPPVITAYGTGGINDFSKNIKIPNYIFRVQAATYKGNYLPYDNMQIEFVPEVGNRMVLGSPTGRSIFEYDMFFHAPITGDTYKAKVNVTAWDDEGNSSFKSYELTYESVGDDQVIGKCEVFIDMTTIGFGIEYSGYEYEVRKGAKASDCVLAALDYYGITADYSGTPRENFYLRGLRAGLLTYRADIPGTLEHLLELDGLSPVNGYDRDRLYEFDFTRGSGWMYTIDGVNYPGRGMDRYELTGDETITIRFTLAYGKDLGLTSTDGATKLSRYCGSWYNGAYHPKHIYNDGGGSITAGRDCEEGAEVKCWHCQICGKYFMSDDYKSVPVGYEEQEVDEPSIILPAGEHSWEEIKTVDATSDSEGYTDYRCITCGATRRETIPPLDQPIDGANDQ